MTARPCRHCGASEDGDLQETVAHIIHCVNCQTDIECHGRWTGRGFAIMRELRDRFGIEALKAAWNAQAKALQEAKK